MPRSEIILKAIEIANNFLEQLNDLDEINLTQDEKEALKKSFSLDSYIYEKASLDDAMARTIKYIDKYKMGFFEVKRKDVAKTLSIAPATLSRRLGILEEDGIINRAKGEEHINEKKLQEYIEKINSKNDKNEPTKNRKFS